MVIKFLEHIIDVDPSLAVDEKRAIIARLIQEAGTAFSHLIIDGRICGEDYESYLTPRIDQVRQIELITKPMVQMLDESISMTRDYLERAIPEIKLMADELYQNLAKEAFNKLASFIEGLQWLLKVAGYFQGQPASPGCQAYSQFATAVQNCLGDFEVALSNSDQVLLADLLTYEFLPALELLYQNLKQGSISEAANDLN